MPFPLFFFFSILRVKFINLQIYYDRLLRKHAELDPYFLPSTGMRFNQGYMTHMRILWLQWGCTKECERRFINQPRPQCRVGPFMIHGARSNWRRWPQMLYLKSQDPTTGVGVWIQHKHYNLEYIEFGHLSSFLDGGLNFFFLSFFHGEVGFQCPLDLNIYFILYRF